MTIQKTPIKTCPVYGCGGTYPETEPTCPECHMRDCDVCSGFADSRHLYTIKLFAGEWHLCQGCREKLLDLMCAGGEAAVMYTSDGIPVTKDSLKGLLFSYA